MNIRIRALIEFGTRVTGAAAVVLLLSAGGCGGAPGDANRSDGRDDSRIAAKLGERVITLDEVDAAVELQLYDLSESIYQLRRASLDQLLDTAGAPAGAVVYLTPPVRPRLDLPRDDRPLRGAAAAPVRLSVFCSYQSSHCVRLQPTLIALLQEYDTRINLAYYDLPQAFHRHGQLLAEAVRCAGEQGAKWKLQDHILARVDNIDRVKLLDIAARLQLDTDLLDTCLTERRYRGAVERDRALAGKLGIKGVPVTFVNGIYLRGSQSVDTFSDIIDRELISLGLAPRLPTSDKLVLSRLPIKMVASSVSNDPERSKALLEIEAKSANFFQTGDILLPQVTLQLIDHDGIIIDNRGRLELVRLWTAGSDRNIAGSRDISLYADTAGTVASDEDVQSQTDTLRLPKPTAVLPLSRNWVDSKLLQQVELEQQIEKGEHRVEGHNLMKLSRGDLDEFYQLLGMEPGDVLMMVDSDWVHSGHNPLWEALRTRDNVTAVVMRKGLPVVYQYHIEADGE